MIQDININIKPTYTLGALEAIAQAANGHMRDAIVLLEKCMQFSKNITVNDVTKVLGVSNYDVLFGILNSILNRDKASLLSYVEQLTASGMDLKLFIKNFLRFVLEINKYIILKTQTQSSEIKLDTIPNSFNPQLELYNQSHSEVLKHLLTTLLELNSSIRWETEVRPVLESQLLLEIL